MGGASGYSQDIPLPEHPRPDYQRSLWQNLNGTWEFAFDFENTGIEEGWFSGNKDFNKEIHVPFPWGSRLSGVEDEADIAWYRRSITVDPSWQGKRVFITIGASDWETELWLDGEYLGKHQGGYVPFSFELTEYVEYGKSQELVIRVDDARREFTLYGKQGYGNARGIWQTVYLEARGRTYLEALHFAPDIDRDLVNVIAYLPEPARKDLDLDLNIKTPGDAVVHKVVIPEGKDKLRFSVELDAPRLWSLEDPYLYELKAVLDGEDEISTYFGMRKISTMDLPGTDYSYIALNNEPVYLQLALDQSYHPDGYYTFPSDQFMKDEIIRSKSIGLNGIRTHIKMEVPRKLYWADRLGLLVMEDLPNSWGEPDHRMQTESEYTLREMIRRDYNHPSIFSWIVFNETWGLYTFKGTEQIREHGEYRPETQAWVASMYYLAKSLDQTRLVEDNSPCCGRGHTETDINSWHQYLPGWLWEEKLQEISDNTYDGSTYLFEKGYRQWKQPNINSECGNVWGYEGSTGDVDWSWDYHRMINTFRTYPRVAGWLYTEHHDVINEWNGYWRFDRSEKYTGMGEIVEGMTLNDLHAEVYLSTGNEICRTVRGGEELEVPLFLSVMTNDSLGEELLISYEMEHCNSIGDVSAITSGEISVPYDPYMQLRLDPLILSAPETAGLATLKFRVKNPEGEILQSNFMHFEVLSEKEIPGITCLSIQPLAFEDASWSRKQWEVLDGIKVNGAGKGHFKYAIRIPEDIDIKKIRKAEFKIEVSAKELFIKDRQDYDRDQDFMLGSQVAPSANPNAYPMTDETTFPSEITISLNGVQVQTTTLKDDPADHRGVLSWHHQLQDRKLREAGSYGYLVSVPVSKKTLKEASEKGQFEIILRTSGEGGIAVYGKEFGRYPLDPSLVLYDR